MDICSNGINSGGSMTTESKQRLAAMVRELQADLYNELESTGDLPIAFVMRNIDRRLGEFRDEVKNLLRGEL